MATLPVLKEFCNEVRKAGGAEQIGDLMPSYPQNPNSCLIANNLNFGCSVDCDGIGWYMELDRPLLAEKIAKKLGLELDYRRTVRLPAPIGRVAEAYDEVHDLWELKGVYNIDTGVHNLDESDLTIKQKNLIKKFWPYLSEGWKTEHSTPSFIKED